MIAPPLRLTALVLSVLLYSASSGATEANQHFLSGVAAYDRGDFAQAATEWKIAVAEGDLAAARNLGHLYRWGKGTELDWNKAADLYAKATVARQGRAEYNLGMMYALGGPDFPVDRDKAVRWLVRASKAGQDAARQALEKLESPTEESAPNPPPIQAAPVAPEISTPPAPTIKAASVTHGRSRHHSSDTAPLPTTPPDQGTFLRAHVGSFKKRDEAERSWQHMHQPRLDHVVAEVDLGEKGIWYRLYVIGADQDIRAFCATQTYCAFGL